VSSGVCPAQYPMMQPAEVESFPLPLSHFLSPLWTVLHAPFSAFAEAIRGIKVAADLSQVVRANNFIGVTSSLRNEGKSTIAMAPAEVIAHGGGRVALIDCDLRTHRFLAD
jgi:Mrp family chromosome partitioning ATPase